MYTYYKYILPEFLFELLPPFRQRGLGIDASSIDFQGAGVQTKLLGHPCQGQEAAAALAFFVLAQEGGQDRLSPVQRIQQDRRVQSLGAMDADLVPPTLPGFDLDAGKVFSHAGFHGVFGPCRATIDGAQDFSAAVLVGQLFRAGTHQGPVGLLRSSEKELGQQERMIKK